MLSMTKIRNSTKSVKKSKASNNLLWDVTRPGLAVLALGITYAILQSSMIMSKLHFTFDQDTGRFINHSTWWIVLTFMVGVAITVAFAYWAWKIGGAVSQKPAKVKKNTSKQSKWLGLATWSATIPLLGLVFMATFMNVFTFWSWRYFETTGEVLSQMPGWYTGILGTLSGVTTIIFVSLPFFIIFTLYFLAKGNLLKR